MDTANQAGRSARDLAQKIARQAAAEPLEIFNNVETQVSGIDVGGPRNSQGGEDQAKIIEQQRELQDKAKSGRRMEALNQELRDIQKQDLFSELQSKIAQGVEVPITDYTELSMEQKQVLNAQLEAYKNQRVNIENRNKFVEFPVIHSKLSRRFGAGQRQEAGRQQTRVEKPVPPSG